MTTSKYMGLAISEAKKGRCKRRQIGCVLTDENGAILASASNAPPDQMQSCFDNPCPDADVPAGAGTATQCYAVHAEQRALMACDVSKLRKVFSTKAPCTSCTLMLLNTPCEEIAFVTDSNEKTNEKLWRDAGRKWTHVRA